MKRIIIALLLITMLLCIFTGCANKISKTDDTKPTIQVTYECSDKAIRAVNEVISYAEQYLNGEIDYWDAEGKRLDTQVALQKYVFAEDTESNTYFGDYEILRGISKFAIIFKEDAKPSEIKEGIKTLKSLIK